MNTHATADRQWTEQALDNLIIEKQFRLRGLEVTRLDTFIDAAFAFVLTLLVISFDDIPSDYTEMLDTVKKIPAFFASFTTLMLFWLQHRRWSRRYGLESNRAVLLSLSLIFVVLVYVYPLRMIFEAMFDALSGGYLTASFQLEEFKELRAMFIYYSAGWFLMSIISSELYGAALRNSVSLGLNKIEFEITRDGRIRWIINASTGLLSILLALTLPDGLVALSGYLYFILIPLAALSYYVKKLGRKSKRAG